MTRVVRAAASLFAAFLLGQLASSGLAWATRCSDQVVRTDLTLVETAGESAFDPIRVTAISATSNFQADVIDLCLELDGGGEVACAYDLPVNDWLASP